MTEMQLWWVDKTKTLRKFDLGSTYPTDIQKEGRLYLYLPDPDLGGTYRLYNLSAIPNLDLSKLTSADGLEEYRTYRTIEPTYACTYDVLRRSGWSVKHTNKLDRVKDNQLRESLDLDLVVSTTELKDFSNLVCFVNGVYHQHVLDVNNNDIYIIDGAQTLRVARTNNDVTIIDFSPSSGRILAPLTKEMLIHVESLPKSLMIDISSLKVNLKDYTPMLIIDGYLHPVGVSHRSVSDTVIEVTVGVLDLLRNYLTSPCLRKTRYQLPVTDTLNPTSDLHDSTLDAFVSDTVVDKSYVESNDWLMARLCSSHSAILLLPKTTVSIVHPVQHETDETWWAVLPERKTAINSILTVDGKVFSPLYLHTGGYRERTLVAIPYKENREMYSLLDPNSKIIADPSRDVKDDSDGFHVCTLTQWWNLPILGELQ